MNWADLGIYRTIAQLNPALSVASAHPALEALFIDESVLPLLETLETYLDTAGNAHATAALLHLHRATLYYRLQRIEDLTGASLKNGGEVCAFTSPSSWAG